jgi:pimeloyl-ACP methyl ester carboxylesterase
MQLGPVRRSRLGFGTCFTDPTYADGEFADLFVRPLAEKQVGAGQMALLASFDFAFVDRLADVHARIRAPTLCIWGERDPWFPVAKARAMLPQFAGAELATIPGAKLFATRTTPRRSHRTLARSSRASCWRSSRRVQRTPRLEALRGLKR